MFQVRSCTASLHKRVLLCNGLTASTAHCHTSQKDYQRDYYAKNKDKVKENARKYYQQNPDKFKEYRQKYYKENAEEYKQYMRQYNQANRAKILAYQESNKEKKREYMKEYNKQNREAYLPKKKMYNDRNAERAQKQKEQRKEDVIKTVQEHSGEIREEMEKELNISSPSDWYAVNAKQLAKTTSGRNLIKKHIVIPELLRILYPAENWIDARFKLAPKSTWNSAEKTREFLLFVKTTLGVENTQDWYRVSNVQLGGGGLLASFGKLSVALKFAFPEIQWENTFCFKGKRSTQWLLYSFLQRIFPKETEIVEDYLHPSILSKSHKLQLDVWLPRQSLAFEYQGEQHYHDMGEAFGPSGNLVTYTARDTQKKTECEKLGITLVTVPYWWDSSLDSLQSVVSEGLPLAFEQHVK